MTMSTVVALVVCPLHMLTSVAVKCGRTYRKDNLTQYTLDKISIITIMDLDSAKHISGTNTCINSFINKVKHNNNG